MRSIRPQIHRLLPREAKEPSGGFDNKPDRTKSEPPVRHKRRQMRGPPTQSNSTKQDTPSTRKILAK
ncbi:hypothetical protein FRC18_012189 [Serendipita sp. 400]|nr:hypothetical protein FRC18_012189 [Serendipita sp. 400]